MKTGDHEDLENTIQWRQAWFGYIFVIHIFRTHNSW